MVRIVFYEKPGCINNTRQKRLLADAGYEVIARDLLIEPWTRQTLARYFGNMVIADRFNPSAPRVASGEIDLHLLDENMAYALMLAEPLLIRRPLMNIGDHYLVGFNEEVLKGILTLARTDEHDVDLESCPRKGHQPCGERAVE